MCVYDRRRRHNWLAVPSVDSGMASPILEANTLEEALDGKENIKWPVPDGKDHERYRSPWPVATLEDLEERKNNLLGRMLSKLKIW